MSAVDGVTLPLTRAPEGVAVPITPAPPGTTATLAPAPPGTTATLAPAPGAVATISPASPALPPTGSVPVKFMSTSGSEFELQQRIAQNQARLDGAFRSCETLLIQQIGQQPRAAGRTVCDVGVECVSRTITFSLRDAAGNVEEYCEELAPYLIQDPQLQQRYDALLLILDTIWGGQDSTYRTPTENEDAFTPSTPGESTAFAKHPWNDCLETRARAVIQEAILSASPLAQVRLDALNKLEQFLLGESNSISDPTRQQAFRTQVTASINQAKASGAMAPLPPSMQALREELEGVLAQIKTPTPPAQQDPIWKRDHLEQSLTQALEFYTQFLQAEHPAWTDQQITGALSNALHRAGVVGDALKHLMEETQQALNNEEAVQIDPNLRRTDYPRFKTETEQHEERLRKLRWAKQRLEQVNVTAAFIGAAFSDQELTAAVAGAVASPAESLYLAQQRQVAERAEKLQKLAIDTIVAGRKQSDEDLRKKHPIKDWVSRRIGKPDPSQSDGFTQGLKRFFDPAAGQSDETQQLASNMGTLPFFTQFSPALATTGARATYLGPQRRKPLVETLEASLACAGCKDPTAPGYVLPPYLENVAAIIQSAAPTPPAGVVPPPPTASDKLKNAILASYNAAAPASAAAPLPQPPVPASDYVQLFAAGISETAE